MRVEQFSINWHVRLTQLLCVIVCLCPHGDVLLYG